MIFKISEEQHNNVKIMVIDDDYSTHASLKDLLEIEGSEIFFSTDEETALSALGNFTPDIFLIGLNQQKTSGFNICKILKQLVRLRDIPVIFLSSVEDTDSKLRAFDLGAVDYITKPFYFAEVRARVAVHLRLRKLQNKLEFQQIMERKVREISEAQLATIFALAKLAEQRDVDTGAHLERVREFCRLLAERLAKSSPYDASITPEFIECIQHASPLHDVGKVAIPDSILLKKGILTPEEFEIMKSHTIIGAENMQSVYNQYSGNIFIGMGIEIALYHHEKWDGTGYPDGLIGRNIPLSARIMALADVYDALRSDRCYRKGMGHKQVISMIRKGKGTHFDPVIVKAFLELEKTFNTVSEFSL
ncbi:MAG: HD domain-containing protein [Desulfuromonadaceae bacterium]|nr:HD domain-containing protein [Desulfuromonadaceae bacterium]